MASETHDTFRLEPPDLKRLFDYLTFHEYQVAGPRLRDGAVMMEPLESFGEIPAGIYDEQQRGHYRLDEKKDPSLFQYTVGPQSFKKFLYPPKKRLWHADKSDYGFQVIPEELVVPKWAFWGIRSCEIQALEILDRVFLKGRYVNAWYQQARQDLFIVAASCPRPSSNCFCTSQGGGPSPGANFDLSVTEVYKEGTHFFICTTGSDKGKGAAECLGFLPAEPIEVEMANELMEKATRQMAVRLNPEEARDLLKQNPEDPHWEEVAGRCLSCANCTMVCPTCFCTTTEDLTDLTGDHAERWIRWDSCFHGDFSYLHGGQIRPSTKSRYRQWLTHKLSSWYDQYGSSGCVGCGRCITWCPVGIDLTEEIMALKKHDNERN